MGDPPRLTILVENQVRELDAKLLLACCAVERGFTVRLGEKRSLLARLASQPQGVFLNKDVSPRSERRMERVRRLGHTLATTDEEALVWVSPRHYVETKVGAASLRQPLLLFSWGAENERVWREHPDWDGTPIVAAGNPRLDLLRPELRAYWKPEADALLARFGRFVLVNTNFGLLNNRMRSRGTESTAIRRRRLGHPVDPMLLAQARHRQRLLRAFERAVRELAWARPDRTLVVRPHPSEREGLWRRVVRGCPNAFVVHEGNATPWLLAADAVVHNGCTTAIESRLLGTPAIAYQPVTDEYLDKRLPNALSHSARDPRELIDRVQEARAGKLAGGGEGDPEGDALLARHLASTSGRFASERMVDELLDLSVAAPPRPLGPGRRWLARMEDLQTRLRRDAARIRNRERHRWRARYYGHVFPSLEVADLESRIARLRDSLGRFERVRVTRCSPDVFELSTRAQ